MTYQCEISSKRPLVGNLVSHANNKTKRRQKPNLVSKVFYSKQYKRNIRIRISTRILRTIDKKGIEAVLKDYNKSWRDFI